MFRKEETPILRATILRRFLVRKLQGRYFRPRGAYDGSRGIYAPNKANISPRCAASMLTILSPSKYDDLAKRSKMSHCERSEAILYLLPH